MHERKVLYHCQYPEGLQELLDPEREHINSDDCWCHPDLVFDGGEEYGNVWVHHGNGEELPPAHIIIEALNDAMFHEED